MSTDNFPKPTNRPGLPLVAYRIGDHASFRQYLLDLLATTSSSDANQNRPLAKLTTRSSDDPVIALLDAWAVVGDVITFYQERLINEAFLRTATERRSVVELARAIGYQLSPGVAATTDLAFMVEVTAGTAGVATVPQGTQILSLPTGDDLPQTFETTAAIVAQSAWNALKPRSTRSQQITPDTRQLYLQGINLSLQPGDRLLLHDDDPKHPQDYLLTLATVEAIPTKGSTRVTWSQQLPSQITAPLRQPQVFSFQQKAGLFGQVAPRWTSLPNELKRSYGGTMRGGVFRTADTGASWVARSRGLPNQSVQCLAINSKGHLFVGTPSNGIWRSTDNGTTWTVVNVGLINLNVSALWISDLDQLFAGASGGNVFRSKDNGDNWVLISQGTVRLKPNASDANHLESINTSLPNTVIHALVTYTPPLQQGTGTITSKGTTVTSKSDSPTELKVGSTLTAAGQIKTVTEISGTALTIDTSFRLDLITETAFSIGGSYLFAGTDEGIYRSQDEGKNWEPKGLPTRAVRAFLIIPRAQWGQGMIGNLQVKGTNTTFETDVQLQDRIIAKGQTRTVTGIASDQHLQIDRAFERLTSTTFEIRRNGKGQITTDGITIIGNDATNFYRQVKWGDRIIVAGQIKRVILINSAKELEVDSPFNNNLITPTAFEIQKTPPGMIESVNPQTITGMNTQFSQLKPGDRIHTVGKTRTIVKIANDTLQLDQPLPDLPLGSTFMIMAIDLYAATDDGVFRSSDYGDNWTAINQGLTNRQVTSLAAYTHFGKGTLSSQDTTVTGTGTDFKGDLAVGDVVMAADQTRVVLAIDPTKQQLTVEAAFNSDLPADTAFSIRRSAPLFAGTADGVFQSIDRDATWTATTQIGLTHRTITCLAAYIQPGEGTVTIDNDNISLKGKGTAFTRELKVDDRITVARQTATIAAITSDTHLTVTAGLTATASEVTFQRLLLMAGTPAGILRSTNPTDHWTAITAGLTSLGITALGIVLKVGVGTIASVGTTVIGTDTRFTQTLNVADTITVLGQTRTVTAITSDTSLTLDAAFSEDLLSGTAFISHSLFAGTEFIGFVEDEWAHFQLQAAAIDLDTLYTKILVNSWLVLVEDSAFSGAQFQACQVATIANVARQDFSLDLKVSRVVPVTPIAAPQRFGLRNTGVLAQSQPLALAAEVLTVTAQQHQIFADPIQEQQVWLSKFVPGLQPQQALIVSGQRMRATANVGGFFRSVNWSRSQLTDPVLALMIDHQGNWFAGTAKGAFYSTDRGKTWTAIADLPKQAVTAFASYSRLGIGTLSSKGNQIGLRRDRIGNPLKIGSRVTAAGQTRTIVAGGETLGVNDSFTISLSASEQLSGVPFEISAMGSDTWVRGTGLVIPSNTSTTVVGQNTAFLSELKVGDRIRVRGEIRSVSIFIFNETLRVDEPFTISLLASERSSGIPFEILAMGSDTWVSGTGLVISSNTNTTVVGQNTAFLSELKVGDRIRVGGEIRSVSVFIFNIDAPFSKDLDPGTSFTVATLFAGTTDGVFEYPSIRGNWAPVGSGLTSVQALAIDTSTDPTRGGNLVAGTRNQGVFLLAHGSTQWTPIGLTHENIQALAIEAANGTVWAGVSQQGIFRTTDKGQHWRQFAQTKRGTGTIACPGTQLRGRGTQFDLTVQANDFIEAAGQTRQVSRVESATALILFNAFGCEVSAGSPFMILRPNTRKVTVQDTRVIGVDAAEFQIGDGIKVADQVRMVRSIVSDNELAIDAPLRVDIEAPGVEFALVRRGIGTIGEVVVQGNGTAFDRELRVGDRLIVDQQTRTIKAIDSSTALTVSAAFTESLPTGTAFTAETGLTHPDISALAIDQQQVWAGTDGGVFISSDQGEHWEPRSTNLTDLRVRCLAVDVDQGILFAGTTGGGIYRSTTQGNLWLPINVGLSERQVAALAVQTDVLAGTAGGVFCSTESGNHRQQIAWERSNQGLLHPIAHTLAVFPRSDGLTLWLGGLDGVFRSIDNGDTWQPGQPGLTNLEVRTLAILSIDQQPQLFAGTPAGIFRSIDEGQTWQMVNADLMHVDVQVLLAQSYQGSGQGSGQESNQLWAGMRDGGVFRSLDQGKSWRPGGLTNLAIQALVIHPSDPKLLFAGTAANGIWRSTDRGDFWEPVVSEKSGTGTITSSDITVVGTGTDFSQELKVGSLITAADQIRVVVAIQDTTLTVNVAFRPDLPLGTPFTINTGLTSPHITALAVDTFLGAGTITARNTIIMGKNTAFSTELTVGSRLIVAHQTRTVTQIFSATELTIDRPFNPDLPNEDSSFHLDYLFAGTDGSGIFLSRDAGETWSLITVEQPNLLEIRCLAIDRNRRELLAGTARNGVFRAQVITDQRHWQLLHPGLTNTDVRAIVTDHPTNVLIAGAGIVLSPDGFYATPVKPDDLLWVTAPPIPDPAAGAQAQRWSLVDRHGFAGIVTTTTPADIMLHPAAPEDGSLSERVTIATPPQDQELPVLIFNEPLQNSYDPTTVSLYGNVVRATHGATVQEILGSGDGTAVNQRFALKKPPLTYTAATTASGAESTLQVFVNDVRWQAARSLYFLNDLVPAYIVQIEDDGTTILTFGDGQKGARLPTGQENVTATYRSGIGLAGNVEAGSLSLLKTRPLGISEVTNPLPASGGADREALATAQSKAPATVRTLDRIVSLQDFEDFARTFAGIGKAKAVALWAGETQLVHLTVIAATGDPVDPDSGLYDSLVQAIAIARDPSQRLQVDSAASLQFNVEARVLVDARYQAEKVLPTIRDRLLTTFEFEQRKFGQGVTASEAIAVIQAIPGVVAVDLDALYPLGTAKTLTNVIPAELARWDEIAQVIQPARLLLINPKGIILTSEPQL